MTGAPLVPPVGPLTGAFLAGKLRALQARLRECGPRVLDSKDDAEAIHDLRVALRRTRTVLALARPVFGRFRVDETRRALRTVMRATGTLRDDEVVLELLGAAGVAHPAVIAWMARRRQRQRRLRASVARLVRGGELERALVLLDALLAFPVDPRRDRRLGKFARRAVELARREVDRRKDAPAQDADALHRLRIAHKSLRYTVEAFRDELPDDLAALGPRSARFQARLGALHDVDVAVLFVHRARSLPPEAQAELQAALGRERIRRLSVYLREGGVVPAVPRVQAAGADSLRKISTR
ncbi:MAG TPA: CHAD domain-containing protein [Polyangiaceae bacterium]